MSSHTLPQESRQIKAAVIVQTHGVKAISVGRYTVQSQTDDDTVYHVDLQINACICPDYAHRHIACKHIMAVEAYAEAVELDEAAEHHHIVGSRVYDLNGNGWDCEAACSCGGQSQAAAYADANNRHTTHARLVFWKATQVIRASVKGRAVQPAPYHTGRIRQDERQIGFARSDDCF